jgi:hypothetical protein
MQKDRNSTTALRLTYLKQIISLKKQSQRVENKTNFPQATAAMITHAHAYHGRGRHGSWEHSPAFSRL